MGGLGVANKSNDINLQEKIVEMAGLIREHYIEGETSIYNSEFVDCSWNVRLSNLVDNLIKEKRIKDSGLSKKDLEKIISKIVFDYKHNELGKEDIVKKIKSEINIHDEQFCVIRPVYGIVIPDADTIELGPFVIFERDLLNQYTEKVNNCLSIQDIFGEQDYILSDDSNYYIKIDVIAKTGSCAIEVADDRFDAFESIVKFMQLESPNYNVSVLNDEGVTVKRVIAISKKGYHTNSKIQGVYRALELNEQEMKKDNFSIIWELMEEYNSGIVNEWKKRVLLAIICVGHAAREHNDINKFLQYIFAMEIVMHNNADGLISPSISNQIAETTAFIISEDTHTRKDIYKKVKEIYSKRSAAVHGGSNNINNDLITKARSIIYCLIHSILRSEELMALNNAKELYEWTMNKRFK